MKTVQEIRDWMEDIRICMMCTLEADNSIAARPMSVQKVDEMNHVWFFTHIDSEKVKEANKHQEVVLTFIDQAKGIYMTVKGKGRSTQDKALMQDLYHPMIKAWFPNGLEDPKLGLLEVIPESAEYWNSTGGKIGEMFSIAKALVTGATYENGEHAEVRLQSSVGSL